MMPEHKSQKMTLADAQYMLQQRGWLAGCDQGIQAAVLESARLLSFRTGQALFHPKDEPGGIYGVVKGGILLSTTGVDGLPVAGHIMRKGGWFGYGSVALRQNRILTAQANEVSDVLQLPLKAIEHMRAVLPDAARAFGQLAAHGEAILLSMVADLLIRDTDRRLASILLRVTGARDQIAADDPRGVPLTQTLFGELANTSGHTVARFVSWAQTLGLISWSYGRVRILDADRLEHFAAVGRA